MFVIKAPNLSGPKKRLSFFNQKTMYGGKTVSVGDLIYIFDSETQGGAGLVAFGKVMTKRSVAPRSNAARQTPRVDIEVAILKSARKPLGRGQLKSFVGWGDGKPQTELNFKLYRQATNKVVGVTARTAEFLASHF